MQYYWKNCEKTSSYGNQVITIRSTVENQIRSWNRTEFIICMTPFYNVLQQPPKPSAFRGEMITVRLSPASGPARGTAEHAQGRGDSAETHTTRHILSKVCFPYTVSEITCPARVRLFTKEHCPLRTSPLGGQCHKSTPVSVGIALLTLCSSVYQTIRRICSKQAGIISQPPFN